MTIRSARPDSCLTATLHHIVLNTPDPEGLADFYRRALGYRIETGPEGVIGYAADRRVRFVNGPGNSLACAGFALPDAEALSRLRSRLALADVTSSDGEDVFFEDAVQVSDPDGNQYKFGLLRPAVASDALQEVASPLPPARLQHVVIASEQPEQIARFFTEVLGFTLSDDVVDERGGVRTSFLRCSEEHHSFAVFKAPRARFDHHCYETRDWNAIRDWGDHLAEERIKMTWGPGRHGPGNNLFFFINDPDGNWLELSAELEVVSHDRPVGRWLHEERTLNFWGQGILRS
jgi:catechol 2,3-dioxygenase